MKAFSVKCTTTLMRIGTEAVVVESWVFKARWRLASTYRLDVSQPVGERRVQQNGVAVDLISPCKLPLTFLLLHHSRELYGLRPGIVSSVIGSIHESFSSAPSLNRGGNVSPSADVLGRFPRPWPKLQTAKERFRRLSLPGAVHTHVLVFCIHPYQDRSPQPKEAHTRSHTLSLRKVRNATMKVVILRAIRIVAVLSAVVATPHVRAGGRFVHALVARWE
jgi:hypothetical protein